MALFLPESLHTLLWRVVQHSGRVVAMAEVIMKIDDLDGSPIVGEVDPVLFGFDGVSYSIDLNEAHRAELEGFLARFIEKARVVEAPKVEAGATPGAPNGLSEMDQARALLLQAEAKKNLAAGKKPYDTIEARAWLQEQGIDFNQMGPLKKEFREIYERHFGLPSYSLGAAHPQ